MTVDKRIPFAYKKIAAARREKGPEWTQHALHQALKKEGVKITYSWLANVETGRLKFISVDLLRAVAKVLGKPIEYFKQEDDSANVAPAYSSTQQIPVYGDVSAENFVVSFESTPESYLSMSLPIAKGRKVGAWRVKGECMKGTADDGDYVIVVQADVVASGRLAIVRLGADYTFKRVFRSNDHVELRPDNKSFKKIVVREGGFEVVAEVVWVLKKP